ncbi:component of the polarisome [Pichia californica]|uniref:Component of the polarisome n=1 Tax=Pichia californica TaxID=460514 RepID=A0A9P6WLI2_9ASCO|nr:component of the polarisome [[Candida] californica]
MPLEEYVANYDSILENKPFKYGNMKGKVLDKSKFFNDYSDYEILLRNEIPNKYFKYFNLNDDIEIGRSNNKLNLSPIKNHQDNGVKESQVITKKETNLDSIDVSSSDNIKKKESIFYDDDDKANKQFKLDLGDLNINKKENYKQKKTSTLSPIKNSLNIDDLDIDGLDIDDLYEKTFKLLNKNSLVDNEGKQLNKMIQLLLENMKSLKLENEKLSINSNNLKLIIKDLNGLVNNYKIKLREYYQENKELKLKLNSESSKRSNKQRRNLVFENNDNDDNNKEEEEERGKDFDNIENDDLDSIDQKIRFLQIKKKKLIERKNVNNVVPQPSIEEISNDIIQKVMQQLQSSKGDDKKESNPQLHHTHTTTNDHDNCPFCNPISKDNSNILFSKVLNPESNINLDDFIDILADRFKYKMNSVGDDSGPEIW